MGSSLSCLCSTDSSNKNNVIVVIKQNGKVIKIKAGTRVKEIVASNPNHVVVGLGGAPEHSVLVLPGSHELGCNRLYLRYFLVADGQTLCRNTLIRLVMAQLHLRDAGEEAKRYKMNVQSGTYSGSNDGNSGQLTTDKVLLLNASCEYKKPPWKPTLHTIPEILSPHEL